MVAAGRRLFGRRLRGRGHQIALLYMGDTPLGDRLGRIPVFAVAEAALAAVGVPVPDTSPSGVRDGAAEADRVGAA
jgi:hypothetical protein